MKYLGLHISKRNHDMSYPFFNCANKLVLNQIKIKKLANQFCKEKLACNYRRINICHKMCTRY